MGVADRTHFLGSVSEAEVLRELRNAHAFALASLAEPLGIAIAEAMAVEVPVVATRAGGVPNLVDDGHDGLLVAPRAPDEIADALEQIATDSTLASALSSRSREKVTRSFHSGISARVIHEAAGATP
jgi:glycosyltransferase involved in cell wall biosynthesis